MLGIMETLNVRYRRGRHLFKVFSFKLIYLSKNFSRKTFESERFTYTFPFHLMHLS